MIIARSIAVGFAKSVGEPLQTLVQTVTGGSAGRLDELWGSAACSGKRVYIQGDIPKHGV